MHIVKSDIPEKVKVLINIHEYTYRKEWERSHTLPAYYAGDSVKAWLNEAGYPTASHTDYESFNDHTNQLFIFKGCRSWLARFVFHDNSDSFVILPDLQSYLRFKRELDLPPMRVTELARGDY